AITVSGALNAISFTKPAGAISVNSADKVTLGSARVDSGYQSGSLSVSATGNIATGTIQAGSNGLYQTANSGSAAINLVSSTGSITGGDMTANSNISLAAPASSISTGNLTASGKSGYSGNFSGEIAGNIALSALTSIQTGNLTASGG